MLLQSGKKSVTRVWVCAVLIVFVSPFMVWADGQIPPRTGTSAIAAVASLIPNDPAGKDFPDLFVGDLEIVEAVALYTFEKEVPQTGGQHLDKNSIKYVLAHWICDMDIKRPVASGCTSNVTAPASESSQQFFQTPALEVIRSVSVTKIIPGNTFTVTVTISVHKDSKVAGVLDFVPDGWQLDEQSSNIEFFTDLKAGESRSFVYSVTVPMDAKPGNYSITGRMRNEADGAKNIIGATTIEVAGGSSVMIFDAVAGIDGFIDDTEMLMAIQLWQQGKPLPQWGNKLSDEEITELLSFWQSGMHANTKFSRGTNDAGLQSLVNLHVGNAQVADIGVTVYDLDRRLLFKEESAPSALEWKVAAKARQLSNGVYIVVLTAREPSGQIIKREVKRLVVLR
ncbi:hypothetical protein HYR54_10525 [Candidatus Acetothermia bacterium]|nr:hypothetical protein [Candidatus Acetothermia bacterium]MBI3460839.1 hypothetical protein [Candidatus Acetothermia bacterium]